MNVNDDFSRPVAVHSDRLEWTASPMVGVDRRMLDRVGDEVARATSIVRYARGSSFSEHTHHGGEEFLVLDGTFQDQHADYPVGTYVRNPIGTSHVPRSEEGCTIFVKLWQFAPDDMRQCAIDLATLDFDSVGEDGLVERAELHRHGDETVAVERMSAGATRDIGDELGTELLVLEGSLTFAGEQFGRHDWIRLPCGMNSKLQAGPDGTRFWIKSGHLGQIDPPSG